MTDTLAGIRVVTTAVYIPGPVASGILRDMGARIVKIEPPAGDPLALAAPQWYEDLTRDVEVQRLDLKAADGSERLHALLGAADLFISASRPASLHRLGLSWDRLHARHPRLCYVAVVGYGAPRQDEAGHDLTYQADAGLLTPPAMPRTLIADLAGAQRVATASLELLLARERGGDAQFREISLAESGSLFATPARYGLTAPGGWLGGGLAAYNIYRTREGWIALAALEPHFRRVLEQELGVSVDDRDAVARALETRTASEWHDWALVRGLPLSAVR